MTDDHLARWHARIDRAATLLGNRLDDPPTLDELAAAASVSPFHFHRMWRALTGETLGRSVARLRIEVSKGILVEGGTNVTGTAMATGFATSQSFARAFRRETGVTPTAYATRGPVGEEAAPPSAWPVRIELRDARQVVALRRVGGAYVALNAMFRRLWEWAESDRHAVRVSDLYGIPLDDPESVPEPELRYEACLAIDAGDLPPPFQRQSLPAGEHACLRLTGDHAGLQAATQWLVGEWLPRSGREPADAPVLHHFLTDPEAVPVDAWVTDILLPLAPAGKVVR